MNEEKKDTIMSLILVSIIIVPVILLAAYRPYGAENVAEEEVVVEKAIKQSKVLDAYGELFMKKRAR